jgi:hypothetical protein
MGKFKKDALAYWISPKDAIIPIFGADKHIELVAENPSMFGLSRDEIDEIYHFEGELYGDEGNARIKILKKLIVERGWIRIRRYDSKKMFSINVHRDTSKNRDLLYQFANDMVDCDFGRYVVHLTLAGQLIKPYPLIQEIASNDLYHRDSVRDSLVFFEDFDDYCNYVSGRPRGSRRQSGTQLRDDEFADF